MSSLHVRFPLKLKPGLYRWHAVRGFLIAFAVSAALWAGAYGLVFSGAPGPGVWFPLTTVAAMIVPVAVLVRGLVRARHARRHYDFDTIVYADSTRVVLAHSLKGDRHELFEAQIHAWLLVGRPAGHGHPVVRPKISCIELVTTDGDVLRSEPHDGPGRLRRALRDLDVRFTEEEEREPLPE